MSSAAEQSQNKVLIKVNEVYTDITAYIQGGTYASRKTISTLIGFPYGTAHVP